MKKNLPYILLALLIIVAGVFFFNTNTKEFNKRISLKQGYKGPYGTSVLYKNLTTLFPKATIEINRKEPSEWFYGNDELIDSTLFVSVSQQFIPSEKELVVLEKFASQGNQVFIASSQMNLYAEKFFGVSLSGSLGFSYYNEAYDSIKVKLTQIPFDKDTSFTYPGYYSSSYFSEYDRNKFLVLGRNHFDSPNFLLTSSGEGNFYLNSNPFLFTNYFILNKNNRKYIEKSFAVVPSGIKRIIWDEYFGNKKDENSNNNQDEPDTLRVLKSYPSFNWAFWMSIILLAIYLLVEVKRTQRYIPTITKHKNESLDFIQTIGKLYFEKQDHLNLAQKMVIYFLEHVRSKYFINTSKLNNEFVQKLSGKSGYPENDIRQIINSIAEIQSTTTISESQLAFYYKQFKHFYKNTA